MAGTYGAEKFSEDSRERLEPFLSPDLGVLVDAIGVMFEQVQEIVIDGDQPGWTVPVTLSESPALAWLGQFVGVRPRAEYIDETFRVAIGDVDGFSRGTPASMAAAAAKTLTGDKTVNFYERDGSAYQLTAVTYTSETPDEAATEAALNLYKPAGIILTYVRVDGQVYAELESSYDDYADLESTFADYLAVRDYQAP
jgi:hypothetical protein